MGRWSIVAAAALAALACTGAPEPGGIRGASLCSRLHREIDPTGCGADVTQLLELTPIGNGTLLARRRFTTIDDIWQLTPGGFTRILPNVTRQIPTENLDALTLLPGPTPRVLVTDPRQPTWSIYNVSSTPGLPYLETPKNGDWPTSGWKGPRVQPWGHEFLGLEDGNVLDRDLADGSTRVWHIDVSPGGSPLLTLRQDLAGAPRDAFVRGHRLVYFAPGRLLEWAAPAVPTAPGVTASGCDGAAFAVWSYSLDAGSGTRDPFDTAPHSSGCWRDIGASHDVLGDGTTLFVRDRLTGHVRACAVDPTADDPLAAAVDVGPAKPEDANLLKSPDWIAPTRSPAIQRVVIILQDGRSFDSYFGRYCEGAPRADGEPPACNEDDGATACCEAMPASIAGAPGGCVSPDMARNPPPDVSPQCMRDKIAGGMMSGFATPPCGNPMDVACAGPGIDAGPAATYRDLVSTRAALADRMFQTFAYFDGGAPSSFLPTDATNLLYLGNTHFNADFNLEFTPFLTTELGRLEVAWTFYAGTNNLQRILNAPIGGEPEFHDPSWYPYRSLPTGELERDIALGQLPSVSLVLPDATDPDRGEGPDHSPANGIAFVKGIVDAIAASPYEKDTLVVITYLTAGGFFDHVRPPRAPAHDFDATDATGSGDIPYGPRVPLLAVGRFAHVNHVSHVQLELSSLAVFIEWNWLHATPLKGGRQGDDLRSGRDTVVNNLGSLLDPGMTGEPHVPPHHDD